MKVFKRLSASLFGLVFVSFSFAEGPDQKTTSQQFKDWQSICVERADVQQCRATQTIVNNQGQTVAVLNWFNPEQEITVFELALPLLIDLTKGVDVTPDSGALEKRDVSFCNNVACFVLSRNDDVLLDSFKKGNSGEITFTPFGQAPTTVRFSLQGFSAAFDSLK